jgi:hypothetical protein
LGNAAGSSGAFSGGNWITMDVTPLITGNGVISLAITGLNPTAVSLASRESGANAPQLVITTLSATSSTIPAVTQSVVPTVVTTIAQTAIGTNLPAATPSQIAPSTSGALTFTPVADAYVTEAIPNTNYGASKQFRVDASPIVNGYMIFNIQGLNGTIASATLKVYANSSSSTGCKAYSVADTTWNEFGITYNTAPPLGNAAGSSGAFSGGNWITMDVTPLITGNGVISLAFTGLNPTAVSLASRESGANAPQLVITTR